MRRMLWVGTVLAMVLAGGQGVAAFGASSPAPSPRPGRAQSMAAEQSDAGSSARALGLGSGERLVVRDVITDSDGTKNVRYDRTFDGLRVIGGDFVSHRDKSGKIKGVSWNGSHKVAVASTSPKIALAAATAAGDKKASLAQQTTGATKGELVVYSGSGSAKAMPKLAYDVLTAGVRADQTPSRLHTIVDANSGATLASWDEIQNGTGNSLYVGQVSIGTSGGPPWTMSDPVGNVTTDLRGDGDLTGIPDVPGTIFSNSVSDLWGNGSVSDRASAAVDAQYGAEKTFDYFKNVQGRNGIWDTGVGARSRVHYGTNYVNAFWDGAQMTYGDGFANAHPLVALDVAAHEMTHGVTENTAGLSYDGESIGLNEATSDIFGTAVEFYADNLSDPPDYTIGEKIDFNGSGPRALRYLDKPSKDGLSKDCWSSTLGSLDPHYSSGPLNHWFYLASEGSGVKTIRGLTYNSPTCNASTVTPIGRDKAAKIWYRTLTTYLTSSSTYASARDGAIQSAKDLYGVNSAECTNVAASFSAIDVPAGAVTCAGTPPSPSGGNLLSNPGFESGTVGWLGSAGPITSDPGRPAHSGSWKMWLGDNGTTATESERQAVTIPSTAIAPTLSYWIRTDTDETGSTVYDTMKVQVISGSTTNTLDTYSNVGTDPNYAKKTFDLSAYVGQTISVQFLMHEDVALQTSFVVDDTAITTAPAVPMGVLAQARNAAAVLSWTAPASNGGSAITGYTVTAAPGGRTATTNGATTATVTGLSNGTAYTFTVTATNAVGTSPASLASTAVTPSPSTTAPSPPVGVTATAGNSKAAVSWTAPASDGGSVVTGYTVTAAPGGRTATTTGATSATVTDLTNGTAYTFTVTATNAAGSSADSARSNSVTPTSVAAVTRLSDFNRDGSTDLVARDVAGRLWLYPGNGAGGFLGRRQMGVGWNTMASIVTPGDVTGDGVGDLVARDTVGRLWLYPGNGSSGLGARRQIGSGWSTMNAITAAGDLNGAGRPDLLARDLGGVLWLYPVSGNAAVGARIRIGAGWNGFTVLGAGDLSGDGRADVLARDPAGVLWLYQGNGAGGLTAQTRAGAGWAGMSALVTPGNWDRAAGNDTLARDATGHLWFYPGNNAGGLGARRLIGSGWNGYTLN